MKKYIFVVVLILLLLTGAIYLIVTNSNNKHFVTIQDNKFILNGKNFYPIALNYIVSVQTSGDSLWACPYFGYATDPCKKFVTRESGLSRLKADMELIKEMGFNTVRMVSIGEAKINKRTGKLAIAVRNKEMQDTVMMLEGEAVNKYYKALEDLFNITNEAGLKIIFLTRIFPGELVTEDNVQKLVYHFREDTAVMAYDLFNEPLYFDMKTERTKEEVYRMVKGWTKILKRKAPHHLFTIGLTGILEVVEWDPNILDVDFISFHPYEYEPEMVRNEMYWYAHYVTKPWIIGETAIPADNDSVSYDTQKKFANATLSQAYNCGALGYSWWQYKDVDWGNNFHMNFMGIVNRRGETTNSKGGKIDGMIKPIMQEFKSFNPNREKDSCICMNNFYNYSSFNDFRIQGKMLDENDKPIQGAVILAWNQNWTKSHSTYSDASGKFELYGNFPYYHWMASATLFNVVRGEVLPDSAKIFSDSIPSVNLGNLKLNRIVFSE